MNKTAVALADHLRNLESSLAYVSTLFHASVYTEKGERYKSEKEPGL